MQTSSSFEGNLQILFGKSKVNRKVGYSEDFSGSHMEFVIRGRIGFLLFGQ